MTPNVLDTRENIRLSELEKAISKGQKQFVAVGLALAEIRDAKLYRGDFKTFAEYCEKKWGFKRSYAYQMIESAGVANEVSAVADIPSERAARELARVAPERREEVLAAAGPSPTAKSIREAAAASSLPGDVLTPGQNQIQPQATEEAITRKFPTATESKSKAKWWWHTAKPEARGRFLQELFAFGKPVEVADKGALIRYVERWLEESVREVKREEEGR